MAKARVSTRGLRSRVCAWHAAPAPHAVAGVAQRQRARNPLLDGVPVSSEQIKFCRLCDAVLPFQADYCENCNSYEGNVKLLEDRIDFPRRSTLGTALAWTSRALLLLAALVLCWVAWRSR